MSLWHYREPVARLWHVSFQFHTGRWPTPLHETVFQRLVSIYSFTAVGTEVGLSLVRKSPFSSLTRGTSNTPTKAKGRLAASRSSFTRIHA
jgi:hypothetical protein